MQKVLIFSVFLLLNNIVFPQTSIVNLIQKSKYPLLVKNLQKENKLIPTPPKDGCFEESSHNYLINNKKLFLHIDGTGKLFEIDSNFNPIRLDQTCYEGYNFGSYTFFHNDTLFNFGGWGFWQYNGGIRFYDSQTREWSLIRSNKEVPFSSLFGHLAWKDDIEKKIYIIFKKDYNSYILNNNRKNDTLFIQCLDLKNYKWWNKEKILNSSKIGDITSREIKNISTNSGILFIKSDNVYKLNFRNNSIDILDSKKNSQLIHNVVKYYQGFYVNSGYDLYFFNSNNDSAVTVNIKDNDFNHTGDKAFFEENSGFEYMINYHIAIVLLALIIIILLYKLKNFKNITSSFFEKDKDLININKKISFISNLTNQEKNVIEIIIRNSKNEELTSIDEVNRVLGSKNKDQIIQKRLRSDVIQSINNKFKVFSNTNEVLIERHRIEIDKRIYQYSINKKFLKKIN